MDEKVQCIEYNVSSSTHKSTSVLPSKCVLQKPICIIQVVSGSLYMVNFLCNEGSLQNQNFCNLLCGTVIEYHIFGKSA